VYRPGRREERLKQQPLECLDLSIEQAVDLFPMLHGHLVGLLLVLLEQIGDSGQTGRQVANDGFPLLKSGIPFHLVRLDRREFRGDFLVLGFQFVETAGEFILFLQERPQLLRRVDQCPRPRIGEGSQQVFQADPGGFELAGQGAGPLDAPTTDKLDYLHIISAAIKPYCSNVDSTDCSDESIHGYSNLSTWGKSGLITRLGTSLLSGNIKCIRASRTF